MKKWQLHHPMHMNYFLSCFCGIWVGVWGWNVDAALTIGSFFNNTKPWLIIFNDELETMTNTCLLITPKAVKSERKFKSQSVFVWQLKISKNANDVDNLTTSLNTSLESWNPGLLLSRRPRLICPQHPAWLKCLGTCPSFIVTVSSFCPLISPAAAVSFFALHFLSTFRHSSDRSPTCAAVLLSCGSLEVSSPIFYVRRAWKEKLEVAREWN